MIFHKLFSQLLSRQRIINLNLPPDSSPRPSYEGWVTAALAPPLLQNTSEPGERNPLKLKNPFKLRIMSTSLNTGNLTCHLNPQCQQPVLAIHSLQRNMPTESIEPTENKGGIKSGRNIRRVWTKQKAVVTTFPMLKNHPKGSNGSTAG